MIVWCDIPNLKITSDIAPETAVRKPLPTDSDKEKKKKKEKPYLNKIRVMFNITYYESQYCFVIEKGYCWDGASIPRPFWWCIGSKGEADFLDASMVHDKMCEDHSIVGYNRKLSSLVLKYMLKAAGVSDLRANTMYSAVDNWQKVFGKDLEGNKWI